MTSTGLSSEQIGGALKALEQALFAHEQWGEALHTTLTCRLQPDERDFDENAHRQCRFGQWCHGAGGQQLGVHPAFAEIVNEHARMHGYAAALLKSLTQSEPIEVAQYERFLNAMKRMRLEITSLKGELELELRNLDPLTGTPGRMGMLAKLREQQALVERGIQACTLAMLDIDHFKAVNDTYGHKAGDAVLVAIARCLQGHLRPYDVVYRYGGEEFLVCLPNTGAAVGLEVVERLRRAVADLPHAPDGKERIAVTVSAGLAEMGQGLGIEAAIDRADKALYAAKAAGRNRTVCWAPATSKGPA